MKRNGRAFGCAVRNAGGEIPRPILRMGTLSPFVKGGEAVLPFGKGELEGIGRRFYG